MTGLRFDGTGCCVTPLIVADVGTIVMGQGGAAVDNYVGFHGPRRFGFGDRFFTDTSSGDAFGFQAPANFFTGTILVPEGYLSNTPLSNSMTFNDATFASLGLTPGTYIWRWGTGLENQNFTLIIGGVGVPDGGTTISLLGVGFLGLAALRRKLGC